MDKRQFVNGDRVRYTSGSHGDYTRNPLWGGKYGEIVGTVVGDDRSGNPLKVDWGGGNTNTYDHGDLSLHNRKEEKVMVKAEVVCYNKSCSKYKVDYKDGTSCTAHYPETMIKCGEFMGSLEGKGAAIVTKAKGIATSIHSTIKPYEKYIGLVALAVVIDHFLLDGKFAHKFKELAEVIVTKIQDGLGKLTNKLTGEWFTDTDTDGEDK